MKFKTTNFSFSSNTTLIWIIVWIISLFVNWISENEEVSTWAFNEITWINAFFITLCLSLSVFIIFSTAKKERLKMFLNISFKDTDVLKKIWLIIFILSICSFYNIRWLSTFSSEIRYSHWVTLSILSWIIIFYSWYVSTKQWFDNNRVYFQDVDNGNNIVTKSKEVKDNMKLPF